MFACVECRRLRLQRADRGRPFGRSLQLWPERFAFGGGGLGPVQLVGDPTRFQRRRQ